MTAKLIINTRLPSFNEYSDCERRNRHAAAKMKRETQELIGWYIRKQLNGIAFKAPVRLLYTWYEPDRKRDKDNVASAQKFVQDTLVACGVLHGDGWKWIDGFEHRFDVDRDKPRVEITITDGMEA